MKKILLLGAVIALTSCEDPQNAIEQPQGIQPKLVVAGKISGSSDVIVIGDTPTKTNAVAQGQLKTAGITDIAVAAYGGSIYRIGKYNFNNLTKYSWNTTTSKASIDWQYSVVGSDSTNPNPHAIAFKNESKAYMPRYGASDLWVINPSATNEADFFIKEINLSSYANSDNSIPNMTDVLVVGDKLFVLLQDLNGDWSPAVNSSVLVLDTASDTVIDVDTSTAGIQTIDLGVRNAYSLNLAKDGLIYVDARGDAYGSDPTTKYTGGVVTIDPASYAATLTLDDGDQNNAPYGTITNVAVADNGDIYFSGSAAWGDDNLYVLTLGETTATEISLGNNQYNISALAEFEDKIYVGIHATVNESAGLKIIDTENKTVSGFIATTLNPTQIATFE